MSWGVTSCPAIGQDAEQKGEDTEECQEEGGLGSPAVENRTEAFELRDMEQAACLQGSRVGGEGQEQAAQKHQMG